MQNGTSFFLFQFVFCEFTIKLRYKWRHGIEPLRQNMNIYKFIMMIQNIYFHDFFFRFETCDWSQIVGNLSESSTILGNNVIRPGIVEICLKM